MSFYNEIKLIFNDSSYGKKYGKMSLGLLLLAVSYNLFICPINLVSGGAGGLGVLFRHLFGIQPSLIVFFVSFLTFGVDSVLFIYVPPSSSVSSLIEYVRRHYRRHNSDYQYNDDEVDPRHRRRTDVTARL